MPNTYEVVGTCDPDGTLRPYGTTAPKAPGHCNDPIVVGKKYILASGAHTGGTAIPEATCLAVNGSNALMISHGLYGGTWPGTGELDISSYMGGLSVAVDDAYLPRAQGGITGPTTTTPTGVSVYNGSAWSDDYSNIARGILAEAASKYGQLGGFDGFAFLGTSYNSSTSWLVTPNAEYVNGGSDISRIIVPTFILDLTRVQISGAYISLANPEGRVDAHNVTYGDSDVDTALTELNSNLKRYTKLCDIGSTVSQGDVLSLSDNLSKYSYILLCGGGSLANQTAILPVALFQTTNMGVTGYYSPTSAYQRIIIEYASDTTISINRIENNKSGDAAVYGIR